MSHYARVIPRDLFNEAKLLKCLGMLYLAAECAQGALVVEEGEDSDYGWDVAQNEDDGSISARGVVVTYKGVPLHCYTPMNSRAPHPLWAMPEDGSEDAVEVFDAAGKLSAEFLRIGQP